MTLYFFRKYHAASHAQGNTRKANIKASLAAFSVHPASTVDATGWAE